MAVSDLAAAADVLVLGDVDENPQTDEGGDGPLRRPLVHPGVLRDVPGAAECHAGGVGAALEDEIGLDLGFGEPLEPAAVYEAHQQGVQDLAVCRCSSGVPDRLRDHDRVRARQFVRSSARLR